jgi:hypothetical protein
MGMRNYCAGYYDEESGKINFWIQAEKEVGVKGTMGYLVDVPRLLFGQAGYHLYHQNKRQLLNDVFQMSYDQPPPSNNYYGQQPEDQREHRHFQRFHDAIGGFSMPQANN